MDRGEYNELKGLLVDMRREHREDHADLKAQLANMASEAATTKTQQMVHDAVCHQDRAELRKDVEKTSTTLWKLVLAVLGGGSVAGGAASYLLKFMGGG